MVGRLVSFWDDFLAGSMLVSGNVYPNGSSKKFFDDLIEVI